jgi:hypothetical protein
MTKKESEFIEALRKCVGKWVATDDEKVVACGDTVEEVKKKTKEANIKRPIIFQLPHTREGRLFF